MSVGNSPEIFLDTDVAFDIISKREPHFTNSVKLIELAAENKVRLIISEACLANLFYLTFDIYKIRNGVTLLQEFIQSCVVVSGSKEIAISALRSSFKDKEDALQYGIALHSGSDYFITRNIRDYKKNSESILQPYTPEQFLNLIKN